MRSSGLRDRDDERPVRHDGVPVPVFGRVFHLHRDACEFFDHVFADEGGVPAGAARGDHDPLDALHRVLEREESAELRRALLLEQAAPHGVPYRIGLLEDLLEHEVLVAAALDLSEIPVHPARLAPNPAGALSVSRAGDVKK